MSPSDRSLAVDPRAREAPPEGPSAAVETRTAYLLLAGGLVLLAAYVLRSAGGFGTSVYLVCGAYGTGLTVVGAVRLAPALRRPWWFFVAGQALALLGDSLHLLLDQALHVPAEPSVGDVAYLLQYPALALGFLWLVRSRRRDDRAALLDAAILSAGAVVVGAVFFVVPAAGTGGAGALSQVVAACYPAGDLLVFVLVVRLLTGGLGRNPATWAMLGSIGALLVGDLSYVMSVTTGAPYPDWVDGFFLLSYLLLGFAPLHPSVRRIADPLPRRSTGITVARLAWLGVALMVAPVTNQLAGLAGFDRGWWVVAGGGVVAVLVVLRLAGLVRDLQLTADQLAALARRDALTGVPNRRTWDHELARAHARAREQGTELTAGLIDLDRFKQYNDTHGHLKGDRVLRESAAAWASIIGDRGFLARYGGEEFTVLLPGVTPTEALPLLERLRLAVGDGQTCSIGVAAWDGAEDPSRLVARADQALYHAKRAGRDRIAVHDGTWTTVVSGRAWEDRALRSLRTVYQPIVDLRTGEVVGREALSRFEDQATPAVFERAHRDGSAVVLETAAIWSALAGWDGVGWLSINASVATLVSPRLDEVLPPDLSAIVIELTEEDIAYSPDDVLSVLGELRARGARLAIDDYGVGSSNVQRIVMCRPDIIKLDISIIQDIDTDEVRQAVVSSVLLFAQRTGALVLAEGIETVGQQDTVARLGVHLGQGFLLGRPAPLPRSEPGVSDALPATDDRSATRSR